MIGDFFSMLLQKITAVVSWFGSIFVAAFASLWDLLRDFGCWILDQLLGVVLAAVSSVDVSGLNHDFSVYGSIPSNVMQVMSALGLGIALGLIASALLIRFTLQLIPFVRLGS